MSYSNGPRIVTNGLVMYLDAGNSKSYPGSGTAWNDLSGNGNNGTLTNGPTFSSSNQGGIVLDGLNDRIQATSPFGDIDWSVTPFSCCIFARITAYGDRSIANLNSLTSSNYICTSLIGYGRIWWYFVKNSTSTQSAFSAINSENAPETNHIVITYNGSGLVSTNIKFYRNGIQLSTLVGGGATVNNETSITIGGVNYPFQGTVYSFSLYNRALSASEVSQNYNATKGRFAL